MTSLELTEQGTGRVEVRGEGEYVLKLSPPADLTYSNAQITDYRDRDEFDCEAPVEVELYARFDGSLAGTAGFGFWNAPYGKRIRDLRIPRALWFFHASDHSRIALAMDRRANGLKAAIFNPRLALFGALVPFAPVGFLLTRIPRLYRTLWPLGQLSLGVAESDLDSRLLGARTHYRVAWGRDRTEFYVDGVQVLSAGASSQRLGFIAWIDNQFATVTPQGRFGGGVVPIDCDQALHIDSLRITPG